MWYQKLSLNLRKTQGYVFGSESCCVLLTVDTLFNSVDRPARKPHQDEVTPGIVFRVSNFFEQLT